MAVGVRTDGTGIDEPLLPPYQALTHTKRGPIVMVFAATFIVVTTLTAAFKIRQGLATDRKSPVNDVAVFISTVLGIGYTICICQAVTSGLGQVADELDESMIAKLSKYYFASNILLVPTVACARAAVIFLIIDIQPFGRVTYASYVVLGCTILWGIISMVFLGLQCGPNRWALGPSDKDSCLDQYTLQIAIRAADAFGDIATVILPIFMMHNVQMPRKERLKIICSFGLRVITPITTAISIIACSDYYKASLPNRPFEAVTLSLWTSAALNLSILTACIPSITKSLTHLAAGSSGVVITNTIELEHSAGGPYSRNDTYGSRLGSQSTHRFHTTSSRDAEVPNIRQRDDPTESVRGLTDEVTFGYRPEDHDEGTSSDGKSHLCYEDLESNVPVAAYTG